MFNLEQAIENWRQQMQAAGIKSPAHLNEMEGHLREEVGRQRGTGLDEPSAWAAAVQHLGRAEALQQEFYKAGAARQARLRPRGRLAVHGSLGFYSICVTAMCLFESEFTLCERLSGLASVAVLMGALHVVWKILPRFFPGDLTKPVQSVVGILGGAAGMGWLLVFMWLILPRCEFLLGQVVVAVFWAIVPMIVLTALGFAVTEKCEREQMG